MGWSTRSPTTGIWKEFYRRHRRKSLRGFSKYKRRSYPWWFKCYWRFWGDEWRWRNIAGYVDDCSKVCRWLKEKAGKTIKWKTKGWLDIAGYERGCWIEKETVGSKWTTFKSGWCLKEDCRFNAYPKPGHTNSVSAFTGTVSSTPASCKKNSRTNCCPRSVSWRALWLSNESSSRNQWQEAIHTSLLFW